LVGIELASSFTGLGYPGIASGRVVPLSQKLPVGRKAATCMPVNAKVVSIPRLGGLHHRYDRAA
jgi:hypothetical protein